MEYEELMSLHKTMEDKLLDAGFTLISRAKLRTQKSVVRCNNCGEIIETTINAIITRCGNGKDKYCGKCSRANKEAARRSNGLTPLAKMLRDADIISTDGWDGGWGGRTSTQKTVNFKNVKCGHEFVYTPVHMHNLVKQGISCPICNKAHAVTKEESNVGDIKPAVMQLARGTGLPDDTLEKLMDGKWVMSQLRNLGTVEKVAETIGIHKNTLNNWLRAHEIERNWCFKGEV